MAWVAEQVVAGPSTRSAAPRPADTIALLSTLLSVLPSPGIARQLLGQGSLSERLDLGGLLALRDDVNHQLGTPSQDAGVVAPDRARRVIAHQLSLKRAATPSCAAPAPGCHFQSTTFDASL